LSNKIIFSSVSIAKFLDTQQNRIFHANITIALVLALVIYNRD